MHRRAPIVVMAVPQEVDCLVIGGGVSGLTTAFYADKGGAKVCIPLCVSGCLVLCVSPIFPYFLVLTPLSRPIFFSLYLIYIIYIIFTRQVLLAEKASQLGGVIETQNNDSAQ